MRRPVPEHVFRASIVVLLAGLSILALGAFRCHPMAALANWASDDGILSDTYLSLIASSQQAVGLTMVVAALAGFFLRPAHVCRLLDAPSSRTFTLLAGGAAFGLALWIQQGLFDGIPHVTDAISHTFQAHILNMGRWHAPSPPCPLSFFQDHVLMTFSGKWFSKYPPGHALLLAAGLFTGTFQLVVPLFAGILPSAAYHLVRRHDSERIARWTSLLLVTSPLALLLGGSFMSHTTFAGMISAGLLALSHALSLRTASRKGTLCGLFSGLTLSYAAMIRPHEFLMVGFMGLLLFCTLRADHWKTFFKILPALMTGALPVLAFWAAWNMRFYNSPLAIGYGYTQLDILFPPFQGQFGFTDDFGWKQAAGILTWNLERINHSLYGWPASLLFVPFALLIRPTRPLFTAWAGIAVVMGLYFFYNYRSEYECRYYYLALPFFAYLTVHGAERVSGLLQAITGSEAFSRQSLLVVLLAFTLYAGFHLWPAYLVPKYKDGYYFTSLEVAHRASAEINEEAILLIDSPDRYLAYSSGFIFNDPQLTNRLIYARYRVEDLPCIKNAFPSRQRWVYRGQEDGLGELFPLDAP